MRFEERGVVFEVTSLLGKPTNLLPVMPTRSGNYTLKATPKPELSFIRGIKSFDTNLTVYDDFTYTISTSLMSMPIGGERPTTVGVNYSVTLLPQSMMRPRIMDSRVGVDFSVRLGIPQEGTKSRQIYYSHRWNLIPKDKKAYAKGRLSEPVAPIRFYLDDAFKSELYFYSCLLKLQPVLRKCLKADLPAEARSHYEMLLFKIDKTMEVRK